MHVRTNTHYPEEMTNGSISVTDTLGGLPRSEVSVYGWLIPLLWEDRTIMSEGRDG